MITETAYITILKRNILRGRESTFYKAFSPTSRFPFYDDDDINLPLGSSIPIAIEKDEEGYYVYYMKNPQHHLSVHNRYKKEIFATKDDTLFSVVNTNSSTAEYIARRVVGEIDDSIFISRELKSYGELLSDFNVLDDDKKLDVKNIFSFTKALRYSLHENFAEIMTAILDFKEITENMFLKYNHSKAFNHGEICGEIYNIFNNKEAFISFKLFYNMLRFIFLEDGVFMNEKEHQDLYALFEKITKVQLSTMQTNQRNYLGRIEIPNDALKLEEEDIVVIKKYRLLHDNEIYESVLDNTDYFIREFQFDFNNISRLLKNNFYNKNEILIKQFVSFDENFNYKSVERVGNLTFLYEAPKSKRIAFLHHVSNISIRFAYLNYSSFATNLSDIFTKIEPVSVDEAIKTLYYE